MAGCPLAADPDGRDVNADIPWIRFMTFWKLTTGVAGGHDRSYRLGHRGGAKLVPRGRRPRRRARLGIKTAIAGSEQSSWTPIQYTDAAFDEATGAWISRAEVAEIPLIAFVVQKPAHRAPGRLVVRRIRTCTPNPRRQPDKAPCSTCGASAPSSPPPPPRPLDTVAAVATHRGHAIIERVQADLKAFALAHLPSGKFTARTAWLVLAVIAFNLTRAAATLTSTPELAKATTATVGRKLVHIPARVASSARRITLHLPHAWPWQQAWSRPFNRVADPPATVPS